MAPRHALGARFQLGEWTVSVGDGTLRREDERRRVEPRPFEVLLYLAERPGQTVSRPELLTAVWKGAHVEDVALARCVSKLRAALGDATREPRYIETLSKRGYRLLVAPSACPETRLRAASAAAALAAACLLVAAAGTLGARVGFRSSGLDAAEDGSADYARGMSHYRRYNRHDNETAAALFERALARRPSDAAARAALADAYVQRTRRFGFEPVWIQRALEQARLATAHGPRSPEAHKALGLAAAAAGRLSQAVTANRRAIALRPGYAEAWTNLGRVLWQQGERRQALDCFKHALRLDPETAETAADLGGALVDMGFRAQGLEWLERAVEREPVLPLAHLELASLELGEGSIPAARSRLERVVAAVPECLPCWGLLAAAERMSGRGAEAIGALERALAASKGSHEDIWLRLRLARLLAESGSAESSALIALAERQARAELASGSERWTVRWSLAVAAADRRRSQEAVGWFEAAVQHGYLAGRDALLDPALAPLRGEPRVRELVEEMERRLESLRRGVEPAALSVARLTSRSQGLADPSAHSRARGFENLLVLSGPVVQRFRTSGS